MARLRTKVTVGAVVATGLVIAAYHNGDFEPHPYPSELAAQTDHAFHNHGQGFNTAFLGSSNIARPLSAATIDAAVKKMEADYLHDSSSRAEALGYCSIALMNSLFDEAGPTRQAALELAAHYSFENNPNVPPNLTADCRTIDDELLPAVGFASYPTP